MGEHYEIVFIDGHIVQMKEVKDYVRKTTSVQAGCECGYSCIRDTAAEAEARIKELHQSSLLPQ